MTFNRILPAAVFLGALIVLFPALPGACVHLPEWVIHRAIVLMAP